MHPDSTPEGDRIYDLYTGVYKPQIIRLALALDVFSPLAARPAPAAAIASACHCDVVGLRLLLNYLASLDVLTKQGDEYSLSPEAATFLVPGRKAYTGDLIMHFVGPDPWESLAESLRSGQPQPFDLEIHFAQDAWIESYRSARVPTSLEMWSEVGIDPQQSSRLRLLDLACGCAIKSLTLAQKHPNLDLTCLDQPLVLEAARDLAERWGLASRVRFWVADLLSADLGEACYDVCLLGQITHYLTTQQNCVLFGRICRALAPGGVLALDVPMESAMPGEDTSFVSLLLWANSGGRAHSFEDYRSWLLAAGFATVQQHSHRLLSALR
jgi:trans-aconitate methyltransferase